MKRFRENKMGVKEGGVQTRGGRGNERRSKNSRRRNEGRRRESDNNNNLGVENDYVLTNHQYKN